MQLPRDFDPARFGVALRTFAAEAGLSQREIGDLVGLSQFTVSQIMAGKGSATEANVNAIMKGLGWRDVYGEKLEGDGSDAAEATLEPVNVEPPTAPPTSPREQSWQEYAMGLVAEVERWRARALRAEAKLADEGRAAREAVAVQGRSLASRVPATTVAPGWRGGMRSSRL